MPAHLHPGLRLLQQRRRQAALAAQPQQLRHSCQLCAGCAGIATVYVHAAAGAWRWLLGLCCGGCGACHAAVGHAGCLDAGHQHLQSLQAAAAGHTDCTAQHAQGDTWIRVEDRPAGPARVHLEWGATTRAIAGSDMPTPAADAGPQPGAACPHHPLRPWPALSLHPAGHRQRRTGCCWRPQGLAWMPPRPPGQLHASGCRQGAAGRPGMCPGPSNAQHLLRLCPPGGPHGCLCGRWHPQLAGEHAGQGVGRGCASRSSPGATAAAAPCRAPAICAHAVRRGSLTLVPSRSSSVRPPPYLCASNGGVPRPGGRGPGVGAGCPPTVHCPHFADACAAVHASLLPTRECLVPVSLQWQRLLSFRPSGCNEVASCPCSPGPGRSEAGAMQVNCALSPPLPPPQGPPPPPRPGQAYSPQHLQPIQQVRRPVLCTHGAHGIDLCDLRDA